MRSLLQHRSALAARTSLRLSGAAPTLPGTAARARASAPASASAWSWSAARWNPAPALAQAHPFSSSADGGSTPAPARLFSFPWGLAEHDSLLASYRSCADPASGRPLLAALASSLRTEAHALELELALARKGGRGGRGGAGEGGSDASAYASLASRTELWDASVDRMTVEVQLERVNKQWVMHAHDNPPAVSTAAAGAPSSSGSSSSSPMPVHGVRFEVGWETSRHAGRRELSSFTYHARLMATPFTLVEAKGEGGEGDVQRVDHPCLTLLDVSEVDQSRVDGASLERIRLAIGGPHVSQRQWSWFLAFVATHPTDLAFDVLSECLETAAAGQ